MNNITKILAMKPYLEGIEKHCKQLTQKELLETILNMAQNVPQGQRTDFLSRLTKLNNKQIEIIVSDTNLIDDILTLREEVEERISSIENGYYYEKYDVYDEYDNEEAPNYISAEQKEKLEALFQQTGELFLANQLKDAKAAFDELFKFQLEEFYLDIDIREQRARYCRCIYETVPPKKLVQALLIAMEPEQSININPDSKQYLYDGKYPFLQEIIDARPATLPNFTTFLKAYEKGLANKQTDRAALLRLEAVELMKGLEGVAALARKWSKQQPLGYLFLLKKQVDQQAWLKVASFSQEALTVLPYDKYRAAVADSLTLAAESMADLPLVLKGKKEKCLSQPSDDALLAWINEASAQQQRSDAVKQALNFLSNKKPFDSHLYVKASLMAGEINKAFKLVKNHQAYGWHSGQTPAGIVFAGILIALVPPKKQASTTIKNALQRYIKSEIFNESFSQLKTISKKAPKKGNSLSLIDQIIQGLRGRKWPTPQRKAWLDWAENIGKQRVEHIVSNKYRTAYERAAETLCALGEYFILSGKEEHGLLLIKYYRNVQFKRFTAFKREVDEINAYSNLLSQYNELRK